MSDTLTSTDLEMPTSRTNLDRLATLLAWAIAGGLFLSVGWIALAPSDPLGPVSIWSGRSALFILIQAAAIAAVVAAVATLLAGRQLPDAGVFASAVGLALVSLRGTTAEYFLRGESSDPRSLERALTLRFALESMGWFGVIAVTVAVSALAARFCWGRRRPDHMDHSTFGNGGIPIDAVSDIPFRAKGSRSGHSVLTPVSDGWKHMLVVAGVALIVFGVLARGLEDRIVRHGQSCFVVAAAIYVACYVGSRMFPVRTVLWSLLGTVLFVLLGYLWALVQPSSGVLPPQATQSFLIRILPIQLVAVANAAAILSFWQMYVPSDVAGTSAAEKSQIPRDAKARK